MKTKPVAALTTILLLCCASSFAQAHSSPIEILKQIPRDAFEGAFPRGSPVANGLNGHNREGWVDVGEQRGAMEPIERGAIVGDASISDRYWPVIDTSFAHQQADGSFDHAAVVNGKAFNPLGEPTGEAFWLAESSEALLLLRSSTLAARYERRIETLVPRYRAALLSLTQPEHVSAMLRVDGGGATNRLLEDAKAMLLGDVLAHVPEAHRIGEDFLTRALGAQTAEGYFPEHRGPDTSYHAVSCMNLAEIALFVDDPRIRPALARGVKWELSRIHEDGQVDVVGNTRTGIGSVTEYGRPYSVNYPQVVRMFAIAGALLHDSHAMEAARRVAAYHRTHPYG